MEQFLFETFLYLTLMLLVTAKELSNISTLRVIHTLHFNSFFSGIPAYYKGWELFNTCKSSRNQKYTYTDYFRLRTLLKYWENIIV